MKQKIHIITHNGKFHVDDLMAVAALQMLHGPENTEVVRSRDPEVWKTGEYVLDVGGIYDPAINRFDHHQHGGAGARVNGIPYSALGLVWKHYGEKLCGSATVAEKLDREMVTPIDMADNGIDVYAPTHEGIHPYLIHRFLTVMRPTWKESEEYDERFLELLPIARRLIEREIITARDNEEGEEYVRKAYAAAPDKRLIVLDGPYPWHDVLARTPDAIYLVKERALGGGWEVECVRNDVHTFLNRKPLPEEWRGRSGKELEAITGVSDVVFCHNGGFIAVTRSKEGALKLAELALNA
jgi:uncharacterized UPF0160 family protein